jgi:serine/threonine-protein kinase PknK
VIVTVGLALVLNGLTSWIWGGEQKALPANRPFPTRPVHVGGVALSIQDLGAIGLTLAAVVLLWLTGGWAGAQLFGRGAAAPLLALIRENRPDLAIIDIRMPPTHSIEGLEAARVIREEVPETAILVLSAHVEVEHAMDLLASGERTGYLLKRRVTDIEDFLATIERIVGGGSAVDPALVQELVAARRARDPLEGLSPREREVLALMAEGRSNAGIARRLWVTEGTVEKHVRSILAKLRLPETQEDHRRVLAVITFLEAS